MTALTIPIELELSAASRAIIDTLQRLSNAPAAASREAVGTVPAIGTYWPAKGGIYAGVARGLDGDPAKMAELNQARDEAMKELG